MLLGSSRRIGQTILKLSETCLHHAPITSSWLGVSRDAIFAKALSPLAQATLGECLITAALLLFTGFASLLAARCHVCCMQISLFLFVQLIDGDADVSRTLKISIIASHSLRNSVLLPLSGLRAERSAEKAAASVGLTHPVSPETSVRSCYQTTPCIPVTVSQSVF